MSARWTEDDLAALGARKNAGRAAPAPRGFRVTEHDEQVAFLALCRAHQRKYPDLAHIYAVPNGGHRHKATAARQKAEGVRAGVLDLALDAPRGNYHGLKIEMKAPGGKISEAQYREIVSAGERGYCCVVAWGAEEAWRLTERYLTLGAASAAGSAAHD